METRLSNIFKTTNVTNFTKTILKSYRSSISYIQIESTKTTRLLFKGSWILLYSLTLNWDNFPYISGKVTKPRILESPKKSLKTRQRSYQWDHPLRNNDPLKTWRICAFLAVFFFKIKIADILNFQWIKYMAKVDHIEKLRNRVLPLFKLRAVEVATLFHWRSSRSA